MQDAAMGGSAGVVGVGLAIRRHHDIGCQTAYDMLERGDAGTAGTEPAARPGKPKWLRFERMYSNAMWHAGWHEVKDSRWKGLQLATYMDDASRCVTGAVLFENATPENAVLVLGRAIKRFGIPAYILTGNDSRYVERDRKNSPASHDSLTAFEKELWTRDIALITTGSGRPETNGKLKKFHHSIEQEIGHFESLDAYLEYYNTDRLHWSLDMDSYETPGMAFRKKAATEAIRKNDPQWMERNSHG